MNLQNKDMEPWARGPFELIRHANEHLQLGGDTDRRIALIGFDNAIEVCIDVFIKLHPRLRGGYEIQHVEVEKAARNYHTKIEFLDKYVESQRLPLGVTIEAIVWYHSLRNELYHSGNGMVPELHVIKGARSAAVSVFTALFKTDITSALGEKPMESAGRVDQIPFIAQNDEMEFLRLYIDFERALEKSLQFAAPSDTRPRPVPQMWEEYRSLNSVSKEWDEIVYRAIPLRNRLAHGKTTEINTDEIVEIYVALMDLTEMIRASTKAEVAPRPERRH